MVYYSSDGAFDIKQANQALKKCYKPNNYNKFEVFTNEDYDRLAVLDYRRVRYLKKSRCKNHEISFLNEGNEEASDDDVS